MSASRRAPGALVVLAIGAALAACGDDDTTPVVDAGVDARPPDADGGGDAGPRFGPTSDPMLPRFTPCPPGWREVSGASAMEPSVCEPWPETGPEACGPGELHLPGTAGCAPIAPACPAGGFPDDLPSGAVVLYVRAGETGGDGTMASPFGTIGDAVSAAPDGASIAIAPGLYAEDVRITKPLTLRGACGDVIVRGTSIGGTINVSGTPGVAIERLTVEGREGIWLMAGADVTLDSIELRAISGTCLWTSLSVLAGRRLAVRDCSAGLASSGGTAEVREVVFERVTDDVFRCFGGVMRVLDSALHGIETGDTDVFAGDGALEIARTVVEAPFGLTLLANGTKSSLSLEDFVFHGAEFETPAPATPMLALDGATLTLRRARIERQRLLALAAGQAGSSIEATDVLIRDTVSTADEAIESGNGLEIAYGATGVLERVAVVRSQTIAILVDGPGSVIARDVVVLDTRPDNLASFGRAPQVQRGATASFERAIFSRNHEVTVVAASAGTRLELVDVVVDATEPRPCGPPCATLGIGVGGYLDAAVTMERFRVRGSPLVGVQLALGADVDLVEGEVVENLVGVNVQVPDYDLSRLTERVEYRDNETNLDAMSLPVPDPTAPSTMP